MEQAVQPEAGVSMTAGASRDEQWAHEQVVAPDVANQLVVNRGAIFLKIGKASRVLGVRQKSERLVWLSGVGSEQKICWRKLLPRSSITGLHLRARVAGVFRDRRGGVGGGHKHTGVVREPACSHEGEHSEEASSMAVCDVVSISISPPAHVSADSDRCLHLESSSRSLVLEAKDKGERDFWYEELSRSIRTARELQCEEQRRARQRERDLGMHERKQIWETKVLPHFETARTQPSTLQLCWPGVPTNVRARLWHKCIGNQLQITPELFAIFRLHASRARHASTLTPCAEAEESAFKVLDKDLPRTFANLGFFHKGGPLEEQLREVLETYCAYRPDVSYVQGMSYLAGMLLLCMEDKYQAFVSLANLLHPPHYFLAFFAMDTLQIKIRFNVISVFFERHLPALFSRFHHLNVTMEVYLLNWLMTLFAKTLPIDITTRIWDNYLLVGESFMIRATLGLLKWLQPRFMEAPFEDICVLLTQLHTQCFGHVEEDELFAAIASIKISQDEFILVLKSESAKLQARQDVLQIAPNTHLKER